MFETVAWVKENENPIAATCQLISQVRWGVCDIPKKAIVPPVLVTIPIAPLSCLSLALPLGLGGL
jgi:hypothetical protein